MATHDLARLAKAARERRLKLGLALDDETVKAAGTSRKSWAKVENAEELTPRTYFRIDALLRWAPGSCVMILDGGDPVPVEPSQTVPGAMISTMSPAEREAKASDTIQLAAIATTDGMPADQIRALSDRAVRDLKAAGLI